MKLGQLANPKFAESLQKLMQLNLPVKTAFRLKGTVKRIQDEMEKYESVRQAALQKYGRKTDEGKLDTDENNNIRFEPENFPAFMKEIQELQAIEVELATISADDLGDKIELSLDDLIALDGLLV